MTKRTLIACRRSSRAILRGLRCNSSAVVRRLPKSACRGRRTLTFWWCPSCRGVHEGGIDLVRKLDADHTLPLVIYTCTREAYTSAVYSTRHQYLLLTPFSPVEVRAALDKVLGMIGRVAAPVMLRSGGSTHVINPHEVQFVQSQGRKVLVSYVDGRELYAYAALSDLEKQLPGSFVRCHKSYLANMEHVIRGCREALTMTTGAQVPVSQRQYRAVRDALAAAGRQE